MNSSVGTIWAAKGSKLNHRFEFFLATFESKFFNFSEKQKFIF